MPETMEGLLHNINGNIHDSVGGFFEKYIKTPKWANSAERCADSLSCSVIDSRSSLRDCFDAIQKLHPTRPRIWHATSVEPDSLHPDFYLARPEIASRTDGIKWTEIQLIGNIDERSATEYRDSFLRLCQQAQRVFMAQPTRLFLHGFRIHQGIMEPWVFDRSGLYSGQPIDIRKYQALFKTYLIGYQLMDDIEIGMNTFVKTDATGPYILSSENSRNSPERLDLDEAPIMSSSTIVGHGTAVYRAKRTTTESWEFAVKFKWQLPETGPVRWPGEERMLSLVREREVSGVVQLFNSYRLESINVLRKGLQFGDPRELTIPEASEEQLNASSTGDRSSSGEHDIQYDLTGAKGVRANSNILAITTPVGLDVYSQRSDVHFADRELSCVVMLPLGRPLTEFNDIPQLLESLRDAIKGHKSLYEKGILHQDVSVWNVMIVEGRKDDTDPKGMLTDLDLALELQDVFPDGRSCAGTPMFMAVEVLHSKRHTYRHDLESFLYVLLWMGICNKSDGLPENSRLHEWRGYKNDKLAATKMHDMSFDRFGAILSEFHEDFGDVMPLAWQLRLILFRPDKHDSLWTGTDEGDHAAERMYDEVIAAFESSIEYYRSRHDLS